MNIITSAAEAVTRDWNAFFATVNENLANLSEFSVRGLGSAVAGDKNVPEGEGFKSLFRTFGEWSSDLSAEKK